jgi:hypothetical protein
MKEDAPFLWTIFCFAFVVGTYFWCRHKRQYNRILSFAVSALVAVVVVSCLSLVHVIFVLIPEMRAGPNYPSGWLRSEDPAIVRIIQLRAQPFFDQRFGDERVVGVRFRGTEVEDSDLLLLGRFTFLESVSLGDTKIGDPGLWNLRQCKSLKSLGLAKARVSDRGLASLTELHNLEDLELAQTNVTDEGVKALAEIPTLRRLGLDGTQITSAGVATLAKLRKLEALSLNHTMVSDASIEDLQRMPSLREVSVLGCPITDAGAERLISAMPNCKVLRGKKTAVPNTMETER